MSGVVATAVELVTSINSQETNGNEAFRSSIGTGVNTTEVLIVVNDTPIMIRMSDGAVSGKDVCKAFGKAYSRYADLQSAHDYAAEASSVLGRSKDSIFPPFTVADRCFVAPIMLSHMLSWLGANASNTINEALQSRMLRNTRLISQPVSALLTKEDIMTAVKESMPGVISQQMEVIANAIMHLNVADRMQDPRTLPKSHIAYRAYIHASVIRLWYWHSNGGVKFTPDVVWNTLYALYFSTYKWHVTANYNASGTNCSKLGFMELLGRDFDLACLLYDTYGNHQPFTPMTQPTEEGQLIDLKPIGSKAGNVITWPRDVKNTNSKRRKIIVKKPKKQVAPENKLTPEALMAIEQISDKFVQASDSQDGNPDDNMDVLAVETALALAATTERQIPVPDLDKTTTNAVNS